MENSVWGNVCRGFATRYPYEILNEQEREKWKQFEERICMDDRPVQQQFDRFIKMLQHNRDKLKAMQKSTLLEHMCLSVQATKNTSLAEIFGDGVMKSWIKILI